MNRQSYPTYQRVLDIFSELNRIPRPSHHEERVADYLCSFARQLNLDYERDAQNCVVIRKPATPGYEASAPIVLLNHMDMVCVGMSDPINDPVQAYVENGWIKARGTSLGADNGIGLSMALAVLESDCIEHPALEVMTTTNEEDGMTGAAMLSDSYLIGRRVINLDSEDYDTITTGAAGACLQLHRIPIKRTSVQNHNTAWYRIIIKGGLGGHSGVDINKGRCSAVIAAETVWSYLSQRYDTGVAMINVGEANASIASMGQMVITLPKDIPLSRLKDNMHDINGRLHCEYPCDAGIQCTIRACHPQDTIIHPKVFVQMMECLKRVPQGVISMSKTMENTVETSNNIGRIVTGNDHILISTHTRSFIDKDMTTLSRDIADTLSACGSISETVMSAPVWQEDRQSGFIQLTSNTFQDVLGWRPRMVAMHFVLEAGFFVQHFPGIQIASIGPRILEPHSANERVELKTIQDIWLVLLEMLSRLK